MRGRIRTNPARATDGSAGASPSRSGPAAAEGKRREGEAPAEPLPRRKRPACGVFDSLALPTIVFVTICTKNRRPILANDEMHLRIRAAWMHAGAWLVGRYVIMPDHIHLFASPSGREGVSFDAWMKYWKSQVTRVVHVVKKTTERNFLQPGHWDRRLRSGESYDGKWRYVAQNPVRHGLVTPESDWPFQGELNVLRW